MDPVTVLRTLLLSLAVLTAGVGVLADVTDGFRAYTSETARRISVLEHPPLIPPLWLQTAAGTRTSFGELRGRWLLVDFIYTNCTTYCSVQGGEFARLQRKLAEPIAAGKVALLSISFDPARDDRCRLDRSAARRSPRPRHADARVQCRRRARRAGGIRAQRRNCGCRSRGPAGRHPGLG
jgi:protein SCO1/2